MKKILVTNNSLVYANYKDKLDIIYSNKYTYLEILGIVRDKIHEGYQLLTHPLSGSVKPNETPYKTVAISNEKGELDFNSLSIIESSMETAKKFIEGKNTPRWTEKVLQDFELIDYYLIKSAVESMDQFS